MVPGLPLSRICQLLERFEADESAPEPLPEGLLEELAEQSPAGSGAGSDGSGEGSRRGSGGEEYAPASEAELLAAGVIEPASLQMDEESDGELEELERAQLAGAEQAGAGPAGTTHGFALLRELWSAAA